VEFVRCDENGMVAPDEVARLLQPGTRLVSVMAVNNETGVQQPVEAIGVLCRERGVLFHSDAVQAAGKTAVEAARANADLLTLSAHKIGGPKGAGALYIRRGTTMRALQRGGGQERGRRGGTENVPAIVGFGAAAQSARENLETNAAHLRGLRERLEDGLGEIASARINGVLAPRAPHITSVSFAGARAETLALSLDLQGFAVGTGSACASGAIEPSHVLRAMGLDEETARASLRISLGVQNTREEIDEFLEALKKLVT
jgi:cysteine desulfurase